MLSQDDTRRQALAALLKIAAWEGAVLMAVVASWFMTGSLVVLIAGVLASAALFTPMLLRWAKEHGKALKPRAEAE